MAKYLQDLSLFITTEKCFKEYVENYNFTHAECFKVTLSKSLGLLIIAGSLMVKVPQIVKILNNKSAKGINVVSVLLEVFAITAMASYSYISGFPFSSWGDAVFLGGQSVTIAFLVIYYLQGLVTATAFLTAYIAIIAAVLMRLTPLKLLWFGQALNIPVILVGRLMQAYTNYSNGNTGQLSAVTIFMVLFGALARIFTSIQETGDQTMILMFACSALTNGVLALQLLYYWNVSEAKTVKSKKKQ